MKDIGMDHEEKWRKSKWFAVSIEDRNLVRAAPELLKACELLILADGMEDSGYNDSLFLSQIECAIDKAKEAVLIAKGT